MRLCRALSSWLPALPYLVVEVLADHHSPTGLSVASHGTAHAERIPHLRKIYLIEPSVRQVVRATCLRKVSPSLPSVVPLYASASRFFIAIPLLFAAGACLIRIPVPHSSGCALTGHTIFTDGHSKHHYLGVWQRHLEHPHHFCCYMPNIAFTSFRSMRKGWIGGEIGFIVCAWILCSSLPCHFVPVMKYVRSDSKNEIHAFAATFPSDLEAPTPLLEV